MSFNSVGDRLYEVALVGQIVIGRTELSPNPCNIQFIIESSNVESQGFRNVKVICFRQIGFRARSIRRGRQLGRLNGSYVPSVEEAV